KSDRSRTAGIVESCPSGLTTTSRTGLRRRADMAGRARANGEGSIYPHRNGFAAYVWVQTPAGQRKRKYVYGKTREEVHEKWLKLHQEAKAGPVATTVPKLGGYLD